jgi:cation transport regulator ChaB
MRYESIDDLPVHCHLNLPRAALYVYKDAWNRAWDRSQDFGLARKVAWAEVRSRFERDSLTGRWTAKRGAGSPARPQQISDDSPSP